jgi:hypothetical protein
MPLAYTPSNWPFSSRQYENQDMPFQDIFYHPILPYRSWFSLPHFHPNSLHLTKMFQPHRGGTIPPTPRRTSPDMRPCNTTSLHSLPHRQDSWSGDPSSIEQTSSTSPPKPKQENPQRPLSSNITDKSSECVGIITRVPLSTRWIPPKKI